MRRTILQITAVLLIAISVWALIMAGYMLRSGDAPEWQGTGPAEPAVGEEQVALVTDVLAADRLVLEGGEETRLGAIEVPRPGEPFAEEGKQAAIALARDQRVRLEGMQDGVYVYLPEGQLLQELLIAGGYARIAEDAPEDEVHAQLLAAQQEARDANLGLWDTMPREPLPTAVTPEVIACEPSLVSGNTLAPEETGDHIGEEAGVVFYPSQSTSSNQSITLLSGKSEEMFTVLIPAGLALKDENADARYLNRCVSVTGRIQRGISGGPQIELRSYDQIEILH